VRYERDLQVRIRERYRRLFKTDHDVYRREAQYFRTFILDVPALRAIVESIGRSEPELDPDQWIAEKFEWQSYDFPETELGRAKVVWRLLERFADGSSDAFQTAHSFSYEQNINASVREMTEKLVEPFIEFLEERLGSESEVLYLLERLKSRIEAFDQKELYSAYQADTRHGEVAYDRYVRKYLFDQGIDHPFSQPRSASGEADIVSGLDGQDPLVEETKLYDGGDYGISYVAKGFNQAVQYAQDHGKTVAHLVVINLSDHNIGLPSDEEPSIWPPRLHTSGVTVYMVAIRAKPLASASRRGKQTTKAFRGRTSSGPRGKRRCNGRARPGTDMEGVLLPPQGRACLLYHRSRPCGSRICTPRARSASHTVPPLNPSCSPMRSTERPCPYIVTA
jgi:hypothetical protein